MTKKRTECLPLAVARRPMAEAEARRRREAKPAPADGGRKHSRCGGGCPGCL